MSSVGSADIERLANALRESGRQAHATTQSVIIEAANYLVTEMEIRVPVKTGELRDSIGVRVESQRVIVGPTASHAPYVEFDTKPHKITAKPGSALSFMVGGNRVTVRSVNHPGTTAQPFVRPAFVAWVDSLGPMVAEANVKIIREKA